MTLCHILPERRGWVNRITTALYCTVIRNKGMTTLSFFGVKASEGWEIQRLGGEDRLLYWPITSSLDHIPPCYFQGLTSSLLTRCTQLAFARELLGPLQLWFSISRLTPLQAGTKSRLTLTPIFMCLSAYTILWHTQFLINHMTASASLHMCVLFREISDEQLRAGSICNIEP